MNGRKVTAACVLLTLVWVGCSGGPAAEPTVLVKGKVTNGGEPLPLDPQLAAAKAARVELRFMRLDDSGEVISSATAFAEVDGSFEAPKGLPKGKYRIAVYHYDGTSDGDALEGKFDDRQTPIIREITGEGELNIDLSNPEG
jgi:hypothetical protein